MPMEKSSSSHGISVGNSNSLSETNGEAVDLDDNVNVEQVHFAKRKRKETSKVWKEFIKVKLPDGTFKQVECSHCHGRYNKSKSDSTTHMLRHLDACLARKGGEAAQSTLNFQPADSKVQLPSTFSGKYEHPKQREAIAHWILMHEKPFSVTEEQGFTFMMQVNQPLYERIPRSQSRRDCISVYEIEKSKLKSQLKEVSRISLTTDMWKSDNQHISYMCLTGHFIDKEWKLQKRVLNFVDVPPPHGGIDIADALYKCLHEWDIIDKVCSLSVDNASNNDVAVRILRDDLKSRKTLPLDGKLFHTRCCAHIINLMVQDGLSVIEDIVATVHDSVTYINKTEGRMIKFAEIVKQKHISARKLIIDCPTRWNSTYEMLVAALKFKDVFPGYQKRDSGFKTCPTKEEWTKIENVCDVLGVFYDVTQVISGSEYPTSNLFLSEVLSVKEVLDEKLGSEHVYIQEMVKKMLDKFKKYWGDCNLLMALGTVLDPRFKLKFIKFAYPCLYSGENSDPYVEEVKVSIYKLFAEYVEGNTSDDQMHSSYVSSSSTVVSGVVEKKGGRERPRSKFSKYVRTSETVEASKSELDMYLEDPVLTLHENSDSDANSGNSGQYADFDVLDWWRSNKLKYCILSRLAIDILAIPITTVASEATFSAGSRVIDEYRAKLGTETVQICICGGDWVRHLHGMKKKARDDKAIQVDLPIA